MLYDLALLGWLVATSPVHLARLARGRYRASLRERLGHGLPPPPAGLGEPRLWLHACSVGEVEAAVPLIALAKKLRPETGIIVSTVTETGQARARALFPHCECRYLPFDFRAAVRRHLDQAGPLAACLIMETEIWPNWIDELSRRGVPIFIANGRISDRAWPRYRAVRRFLAGTLRQVAAVAARSETDAERYRRLGAPRVEAVGNLKFDREPAPPLANPPLGRVLVVGSTHAGEDELALAIFRRLRAEFADLRLVIAPRHIERVEEVARLAAFARRSRGWKNEDLLLLDTHGELAGLYAAAEVAVIGGSFQPCGGHNPLEAAVHGVPVVWGPHMENFRDACGALAGRGGFAARDVEEAVTLIGRLLRDASFRRTSGAAGRDAVMANRGATLRAWKMFFPRE